MMYSYLSFLLLFSLLASILQVNIADDEYVPFEQNYAPLYGLDHIRVLDHSSEVKLTFDNKSGSGFQSLQKYGSGWFSMRIKMPQKDSAAVITTFYLRSNDETAQDEIDFEFLGGNNKELHYSLQTNIYTNGQGGREQRFSLWFDPTSDFHNYTILWNQQQIVFFVDNTPIRVFKNTTEKGGSFPTKDMKIIATIWTASWASRVPVNWTDAPFEAHYRGFGISACPNQNTSDPECNSSKFWWNAENFWSLNPAQKQAYKNLRSKYLGYNYCNKKTEIPECQEE